MVEVGEPMVMTITIMRETNIVTNSTKRTMKMSNITTTIGVAVTDIAHTRSSMREGVVVKIATTTNTTSSSQMKATTEAITRS